MDFPSLLKLCGKQKLLAQGLIIHIHIQSLILLFAVEIKLSWEYVACKIGTFAE
jgi:hypothetical protein